MQPRGVHVTEDGRCVEQKEDLPQAFDMRLLHTFGLVMMKQRRQPLVPDVAYHASIVPRYVSGVKRGRFHVLYNKRPTWQMSGGLGNWMRPYSAHASQADERPADAHRVQWPDPDRGCTAVGHRPVRVSDLVRGKWEKFSLEMLITLEARMGRQVTLEFAPSGRSLADSTRQSYRSRVSIVPEADS